MNSSAWEKFQGATLSLSRAGTLKERMTDAYRNHLSHIEETELPKELRDDFRTMYCTLTRHPPLVYGDDAFRATIRKMSRDEIEDVASSVVRMFSALHRSASTSPRPPNLAKVVPLYGPEPPRSAEEQLERLPTVRRG